MTPEESALLSDFGTQLFYQIVALICTCAFFGIYLLAASIAFYLLSRRGTKPFARKVLLACLIFILVNYTWVFIVKCAANLVDIKVALSRNLSGGDLSSEIDDAAVALLPYQYTIAWPVTLNLIISDSIVTWRAWVICTRNRLFRCCLIILASASFVVNIIDCVFDDIALKSFWVTSSWDTASAFLSFGLNLVATLLIALKTWQHHLVVKAWMKRQRTDVEKALLIFVESGAAYCLLQLVYSTLGLLSSKSSGGITPLTVANSIIIEWFIAGSASTFNDRGLRSSSISAPTSFQALYPVSVIIIINLERTPMDFTFDEEAGVHRTSFPSLQFAHETRVEDIPMQAKFESTTDGEQEVQNHRSELRDVSSS